MQLKNKIVAIAAVICITAAAIFGSTFEMTGAGQQRASLSFFDKKETLYFWYSDESITDFVNSAAVAFGQQYNARVFPKYIEDSEYLESVNNATLHSDQMPDLYLISNDSLEKAYLAGLASEVQDISGILNREYFPQAALSAVTYQDKFIAYPFFYETSALIYNETYLMEWAQQQAEKELTGTGEEGENPEEGIADTEGEEPEQEPLENGILSGETLLTELTEKTSQYFTKAIPATVNDILKIADSFDVPEGVEGVMKWDVSDIFYNYWMVGNYLQAGGEAGDQKELIEVNNPETIQCLEVYQALNQFFSMESDTINYDSVVQDFIDGKIVFTIATTDIVEKLEEAKTEGSFAYQYGIAVMPDVSTELKSRSLSVTHTIAVNGYSTKKELANQFAAYLTNDAATQLYERTGKAAANITANQEKNALQIFMEEYANSVPLPKMMETSNLWIQLEILFSKVWNGADVAAQVQELSNQIQIQTGNLSSSRLQERKAAV